MNACFGCVQVRWDYLAATDKGYFPYHVDNLEVNEDVSPTDACVYTTASHNKRLIDTYLVGYSGRMYVGYRLPWSAAITYQLRSHQ